MTRCLHIPLDVESLPEFRLLCEALTRKGRTPTGTVGGTIAGETPAPLPCSLLPAPCPMSRHLIEAIATRLFLRHWIEMAYQAERTNQPGLLPREGAQLFAASVGDLFGDDVSPVDLLVESRCAHRSSGAPGQDEGETFCARFAELNPHFAGDYKTAADKGATNSAIVRQQKQLERDAVAQGNLLPLFLFKRRDGTEIPEPVRNRCVVLIMNLDNALGKDKGRRSGEYSDGLIADAAAAVEAHEPEELKRFYFWLANNRDKALVPKAAEQILQDFEKFFDVASQSKS